MLFAVLTTHPTGVMMVSLAVASVKFKPRLVLISCNIGRNEKSSDPDVLFLIDGEVGVEIDHLRRSVCWCGVPCDLNTDRIKQS